MNNTRIRTPIFAAVVLSTLAVAYAANLTAGQEKLYMAGNVLNLIVLEIVAPDSAKVRIAYVSPGSTLIYEVHLTLARTRSEGKVDYFSAFRDGHQCGS